MFWMKELLRLPHCNFSHSVRLFVRLSISLGLSGRNIVRGRAYKIKRGKLFEDISSIKVSRYTRSDCGCKSVVGSLRRASLRCFELHDLQRLVFLLDLVYNVAFVVEPG